VFGFDKIDFKRNTQYTSLYELFPVELILCDLYGPEQKPCKNPQKKCKNCSVYHGFKGSGRLYEQKTK
jgi:hypothetical protein